jgi:hypothetical protein
MRNYPDFCVEGHKTDNLPKHVAEVHGIRWPAPIATQEFLPGYAETIRWLKAVEERCMTLPAMRLGDQNNLYNFLTLEMIVSLAKRLREYDQFRPIVEVFAGDGLLAWWLQKYGVSIVATDQETSAKNHWTKRAALSNVIERDALSAVRLFRPDTVLASWVPYQDRRLHRVLDEPYVKRVIWIGEGHGGCCGHEGIWQHNEFSDWPEVSEFALGRTDYFSSDWGHHHITIGMFEKKIAVRNPLPLDHPSRLRIVRATEVKKTGHYHQHEDGSWECNHCKTVRPMLRSVQT